MPPEPCRILIVEDEPSVAAVLRIGLEQRGYVVQCVGSVEEAMPVLDKLMPNALITDGALPGAQGLSLAAFVRQSKKHEGVKVIVMSGDPAQKQLVGVMRARVE